MIDNITIELALRDLGDITALQQSEAFNRYFLRRLKEKRDAIEQVFRHDPPGKVSHEERETLRRILNEYDAIISMADREKIVAAQQVEAGKDEERRATFRVGDTRAPIPGLDQSCS